MEESIADVTQLQPTDENLFALIDSARRLSPATKQSYKAQINACMNMARRKKKSRPILAILKLPTFFDELDVPLTTKYAYAAAFYSLFKRCNERGNRLLDCIPMRTRIEWMIMMEKLKNERNAKVRENVSTDREKENWVTVEEMQALDKRLRDEERGSLRQLMVAFHVQVPPLRGGDLFGVELSADDKKRNVLTLPDGPGRGKLRVLDHKTRKVYGAVRRSIPELLVEDIRVSLQAQPRERLFVRTNGEPFTKRADYILWKNTALAQLLGKKVTTNILRHMYVTAGNFNKLSVKDVSSRAHQLGHSLYTHLQYRRCDAEGEKESADQP